LRILMVTEWSPCIYGGVASQVKLLSKWLTSRGHEVSILFKEGECKCQNAIKVNAVIPLDYHIVPPSIQEVKCAIKRIKPDIVHVHHSFTPLSLIAVGASTKLKIPCILTNHSLPPTNNINHWMGISYITPHRWLLKPTLVTAVSYSAADFIRRFLGLKSEVKVIPNAVDTDEFKPYVPFHRREDAILYLGRLVHRKGVHILIRAMKHLRRCGIRARLIIAGKGYMEPFLKIIASNIEDITFMGAVKEVEKPRIYAMAKVFVLPSLAGESFGVVLLEALSSGTPVVATRVGGIPEIIQCGIEGILVNPGDPIELGGAIKCILSSPNDWLDMSRQARRKAVERFSIDRVGKLYEDAYLETIEEADKHGYE